MVTTQKKLKNILHKIEIEVSSFEQGLGTTYSAGIVNGLCLAYLEFSNTPIPIELMSKVENVVKITIIKD